MSTPLRHALRRVGWSRRNLWGLMVLPLAAAAALGASSDRVKLYFWEEGLHHPTSGVEHLWVSVHDSYPDSDGDHRRSVRVRLDSLQSTTVPWQSTDPFTLAPGTSALKVTLDLAADSRLPLKTCGLALRDSHGNRYDYRFDMAGVNQPVSPCVPPNSPGPDPALGDLKLAPDPSEQPRPAGWTVSPVIVVPANVTVTEVDLWWQMPDYVAVAVTG
jgi:hypothetical protein